MKRNRTAYNKQYYLDNQERLLQASKQYRLIHKESIRMKDKARYKKRANLLIEKAKIRYKQNPLAKKDTALRANYGITLAEFNARIASQNNLCANKKCKNDLLILNPKQVHVDHDHVSGNIRGILCHWCNISLGNARDDVDRLSGLIEYLKENM